MEITMKALVGHSRALLARYQLHQETQRYLRNAESSCRFTCPVCNFTGGFMPRGARQMAICPACFSQERHRLQVLVMDELARKYDFSTMHMLHVAPEPALSKRFKRAFGAYQTADIASPGADLQLDLRRTGLPDACVDVVYASHVLEHIDDDAAAIAEVRRLLRPGGFAVLPVPVLVNWTIEYPAPVPEEEYHVRAPGPDYFERYKGFSEVRVWSSPDFDERYQTWAIEDRTTPTARAPREARLMYGARHPDYVPVCFV